MFGKRKETKQYDSREYIDKTAHPLVVAVKDAVLRAYASDDAPSQEFMKKADWDIFNADLDILFGVANSSVRGIESIDDSNLTAVFKTCVDWIKNIDIAVSLRGLPNHEGRFKATFYFIEDLYQNDLIKLIGSGSSIAAGYDVVKKLSTIEGAEDAFETVSEMYNEWLNYNYKYDIDAYSSMRELEKQAEEVIAQL